MQESQTTKEINNFFPPSWGKRIQLMAVINITPDSFSDGGLYLNPKMAYKRACDCIDNGADILDLGAQSTRPGADYLEPDQELERLLPALIEIRKGLPNAIISIDTFHSKVAEISLDHGANWINDISGGRFDQNMFKLISKKKCPFVINHSRGNSKSMNDLAIYNDVVLEVENELFTLTEKAISLDVDPKQIIWDPGLGFAKKTEDNIQILKNLDQLSKKGFPLLLGPSRKRFLGEILNEKNPEERLYGTSAVVCRCVEAKVSIVRVHDVKEISGVIAVADKLWN